MNDSRKAVFTDRIASDRVQREMLLYAH